MADLDGLKIVITGKLTDGWKRAEAKFFIESLGGLVTSAISGQTSYLVIGTKPGMTKLRQAREFGIPTITEDELLDLLDEEV